MTAAARSTVAWCQAQVGTQEQPPGSNRGPGIEEWQREFGDWMIGQPWCGAFLGYALRRVAGVAVPAKIVWVPHVREWAQRGSHGFVSWSEWDAGRLGDLVLLSVEAEGEIDHMGIHVGAEVLLGGETHILTVEGNTPSGEGGTEGVYTRARPRSAVVGFARPAYGHG